MDAIKRRCKCGNKIESAFYAAARKCWSCHAAARLPHGYEDAEQYTYCQVDRVSKATERPLTGQADLDTPGPPRICDLINFLSDGDIEHLSLVESQQGLGHDFESEA